MIPIAATGPLLDFAQAGVLGLADVHLARTLSALGGDTDDDVALAVALTMRALRTGSPCLDVTHADALGADADAETAPDVAGLSWPEPGPWLDELRASRLVGSPAQGDDNAPLCLDDDLLYLRRAWLDQRTVVDALSRRWSAPPPTPPGSVGDDVTDAVLTQWTTVLTGGPGTGKTTAIANLVAATCGMDGLAHVAVAAPTGKAAARLAQALETAGAAGAVRPTTLHRMLGARGPGRGFRYDAQNPLPADLVVVDELSMVSLPLMAALLASLRPTTRLLLVGDPDQLASVEAGAVLADLVAAGITAGAHTDAPLVRRLTHVWRHGGALAELAAAAAAGDAETALGLLDGSSPDVSLTNCDAKGLTWAGLPEVAARVSSSASHARAAAEAGDAAGALRCVDEHRLLCAHRQGPYGVATWARQAAQLTTPRGRRADDWWPGRAVLAGATAPDLGVVSGDQGVVVATPDGPRLAFDAPSGGPAALLPVGAVPGLATLDAITVHKSQGSEFAAVTVVLPPTDSPLLIRPLLYTAMTRARRHLTLVGTPEQLRQGLTTAPQRTSGLAQALRAMR